ncbi:hypothetical protein Tco_0090600 [Tanacetum coccineum]
MADTIIEERDAFQAEVPALISKEFNAQAPQILEELFKTYVQNNVIKVHPTTTTSTKTTSSTDPQQQLYLKMKSNLQYQANDPALWDVLKIIEVVRITTDHLYGLDFMEQIIMMRENDKPDSFSDADFNYLNKNDIEDLYYLCQNKKIVKFCDAKLERVLKEVKLKIFQSEPWKKPPMLGKTKDGINVWKDMVEMGIRDELAPQEIGNKRTYLPAACYTLSKAEKIKLFQCLRDIKVPLGYSANIKKLVLMKGLKLIGEIKTCGLVFLHYMYPFERYMGFLKGYVRNRSWLEGSIVEGYVSEELVSFYTCYIDGILDICVPESRQEGKLEGKGTIGCNDVTLNYHDLEQAHFTVLQNMTYIAPSEVTQLAYLPRRVFHNEGYDINGYTFYTKEQDEKSTFPISGLTLVATTTDKLRLSVAKESYYDVIEEIWKLDYNIKEPIQQSKVEKEKADIRKWLHLLKEDIDQRLEAVKKDIIGGWPVRIVPCREKLGTNILTLSQENTHDLGSFGEETDEITDLHQILEEELLTEHGDCIAGIKRHRHDPSSDSVRDLVMVSGRI